MHIKCWIGLNWGIWKYGEYRATIDEHRGLIRGTYCGCAVWAFACWRIAMMRVRDPAICHLAFAIWDLGGAGPGLVYAKPYNKSLQIYNFWTVYVVFKRVLIWFRVYCFSTWCHREFGSKSIRVMGNRFWATRWNRARAGSWYLTTVGNGRIDLVAVAIVYVNSSFTFL
jgi:hypothetical protein